MKNIIDAEVVEIDVTRAVTVTQKPIIAYKLLQEISNGVIAKIESLNIESLAPTDDNLALIKRTRAGLTKDFDELENQRKTVKEIVLAGYNIFEDDYKRMIATPFKDADAKLKSLANTVDDEILQTKIVGIKDYFMDNNQKEWLSFEDMGLKIIKSKSDKAIKAEVDEYLSGIKMSISTIETLQNKDRVLAKFQMHKDLNRAISETNLEVQREEQIKAQNAERERVEANRKRDQRLWDEARQKDSEIEETINSSTDEVIEEPKTFKSSFIVYGTKDQFAELKKFMQQIGVKYE